MSRGELIVEDNQVKPTTAGAGIWANEFQEQHPGSWASEFTDQVCFKLLSLASASSGITNVLVL